MTPLTLEHIRLATHGTLLNADAAAQIHSICTDSRSIEPGCLFIAIRGENHDGHDHVEAAIKSGAVAVMVQRSVQSSIPTIKVDDTRKAMGRLANHVRKNLKATVIAVAGSNGKTGTKNLIHAVLAGTKSGSISPKSYNNDIGVPRAIFDAGPADDYLVLEIGTNHPGEILNLTQIAQPDVAVITNIGAEHLEFFGDLDGVTHENAQIIAGLNPRGLLVVNGDHPPLLRAVESHAGEKITFGFLATNDLYPRDIHCRPGGVYFQLDNDPIFIPLMGRHTAVNAMAAIAVARHMGVPDDDIFHGLSIATGPEMRLQMQTTGSIRILNDAYNANPDSMKAGLETLRDMETMDRRVAILGDMRELGETADRYHREIGQFAAACHLDHLVCVGEKAQLIAQAATEAGMPAEYIERYPTAAACAANVNAIVGENDLVLLKASRGMKLEVVAAAISSIAATASLRRAIAARTRRVIPSPHDGARAIPH